VVDDQVRYLQQGFVTAKFTVGIEVTLRNHLREPTKKAPSSNASLKTTKTAIGEDVNPLFGKIKHLVCLWSHFVPFFF
jgi:hypothetical protein